MFTLLDAAMAAPAFTAIGWLCLSLTGICMIVVDVARSNKQRGWSVGLLLAGIGYAAANVGLFTITISADAFAIFDYTYMISIALVGPALMIIASVFIAISYKKLSWLSISGFAIWIGCVGFAHLFVVAAVSASV